MDLAFRYLVLIQVITRNGRDVFFGSAPDFGMEIYEAVDPGNISQEYMFTLKMRRMIGERLSVYRAEGKEPPLIRFAQELAPPLPVSDPNTLQTVSTTWAAEMLGVHPDTVRSLFDSGILKGILSPGGQRMIEEDSIRDEQLRMKQRADLRALEQRSKKKNQKRRQRRAVKQREEKLARFEDSTGTYSPLSPLK